MARKRTLQQKTDVTETIDLDDVQSSKVKGGGGLPLLYTALTKNESIAQSPRDPATGLPVGKR